MGKLYAFNMITLDGFFEGPDHDLSWHNFDEEVGNFANEQLGRTAMIIFGRITYEMMFAYWPHDTAEPTTARYMNTLSKLVYSRTMKSALWENSSNAASFDVEKIRKLKASLAGDIAIFGSANLLSTVMRSGVLDEYRLMVNPVILGRGVPLFQGIESPLKKELVSTRSFSNGNVLLTYRW
jgi:dihydrofolate reductase